MRRLVPRLAVLWVAALLAAGGVASSKPKPPPKPKPKLELLTQTEEAALRKRAIKVGVQSRRGRKVEAEATFVVEDYPADFVFKLGPDREKLRDDEATLRFPLSARKREVLDFAIKSCEGASITVRAKVGRGRGKLDARLERPSNCRPG
jgi:hypothetical protein